MSKNKMIKDIVPQDFTLKLALVDAIPVIFFGGSMVIISVIFRSPLFLSGALMCLLAGVAKVLWKIIVVLKKKNIWWLFLQMRILMPIGMAVMIAAAVINKSNVDFHSVFIMAMSFPPLIFFIAGIIGMVLMMIFAFKLDSSDVKSNWIEQLTNGIAQGCFFLGLLLTVII